MSIHGDAVRNAPHGDDNVDDAVVIDDIDESGSGCRHCPGEEEYLGCARTRRQKIPRYPPAADRPSLSLSTQDVFARASDRSCANRDYYLHETQF